MARKTTKTTKKKKAVKRISPNRTSVDDTDLYLEEKTAAWEEPVQTMAPQKSQKKFIIFAILLIGVGAILLSNRRLFLAAVINGQPIFRWELNGAMSARYGKQVLEGMISEKLIKAEAQKQGITISPQDVDAKEQEIVKNLGANVKIDDLLNYQGMTRADFDSQVRIQLTVEQILAKDLKITDDDVTKYIASNQATLKATEEGQMKEEARSAIREQLVGEKLQPWFQDLKTKAQILRYL